MSIRMMVLCAAAAAGPAGAAYSLTPWQQYVTGSWANAVAIGDVNGDGRNDVVLTTTTYFDEPNDQKTFVFFQDREGRLSPPKRFAHGYANETGLALADLDGDGRQDVIVGDSGGISVLRFHPGRGGMVPVSQSFSANKAAVDLAVLDVDRDGRIDVFAQSWADGAVVYFGDGRGGFSRKAAFDTLADGYNDLKAGDLNGDGHDDVAVLSGQGVTHAYIYYNDGTDNLSWPYEVVPNPDAASFSGALAIGDTKSDGLEDLVALRTRTSLSLFDQRGDGTLAEARVLATEFDAEAMAMADMDDDGREDLVIQHGSGDVGIHFNGAAGLGPEVRYAAPYATHYNTQGLALGDINGDGCKDVAVANYNYGLVVHLGQGCPTKPDVAPSLALSPTAVLMFVDNQGASVAANVTSTIALTVQSGSLALPTVPAGCTSLAGGTRSVSLTCRTDAIDAGARWTVSMALSISAGDTRNRLDAVVSATTASLESAISNNRVRRHLALNPRFLSPPVVLTVGDTE